jgi:hypothetical protein
MRTQVAGTCAKWSTKGRSRILRGLWTGYRGRRLVRRFCTWARCWFIPRICGVVPAVSRRCIADNHAFSGDYQRRAIIGVRGHWDSETSHRRRDLLADYCGDYVLERNLARLGQLQIAQLFARGDHRRSDLRAAGGLRIHYVFAGSGGFHKGGNRRGSGRRFVSSVVGVIPPESIGII